MKLNLVPLVKALDNLTVYRLFFFVVVAPTIAIFLALYFIVHTGTTHQVTHEVDMDITIGGVPSGTFTIGLFGVTAPKTVQNFQTFATKGFEGMKYEGTTFNRIVNRGIVQGGDVLKGKGHPEGMEGGGRISIYGDTFDDENFLVKHAAPGFVSMTNNGPNTNGCQFFVALRAMQYLDGKHVGFGKVVKNLDLLYTIAKQETDDKERPLVDVVISKSTMRTVQRAYYISDDPYNIWDWLKMVTPFLITAFGVCTAFTWVMNYIDRGIEVEPASFSDHLELLWGRPRRGTRSPQAEARDGGQKQKEAQEKIHKKQVARESKKAKLEATEMDENTRRRKGHDEETAKPAEVVEDDASKPKAT